MSEALRLATTPGEAIPVDIETTAMLATELRRLHALNAELVEALRWCIRQMPEPVLPGQYTDDYKAARAVLKKVEARYE